MDKAEAKNRIRVNLNKLFLDGEMFGIQDEYQDKVNYSYLEENEKVYRLMGLIR